MRILALTWTTTDGEKLMINARRDLICPAIDGLTNELLGLGHQVVYVNVAAEEYQFDDRDLKCPAMLSGLPYRLWKDIKKKDFDVIWHAIKDPTPPKAIKHINKIMLELENDIPILNNINHLKDHNKRKYITLMRSKGVGAIILDNYIKWLKPDGKIDPSKCFPPSNGAYVSLDKHAIRLHLTNSQRYKSMFDSDGGITLKYHDTTGLIKKGLRSFFRVPFAAGKCMEGIRYHCPPDIMCPKSGAAIEKEPYSIPDMTAGTISASMQALGVDVAHIEGINAGFSVEIFDVNPFPSSHGASLSPMSAKIAKRLEQVYDI